MKTYRPQMEFHHCQTLLTFQSSHNLLQLVYFNNILWPGTVPNAFMTWSRLSVEPTEFAIALKWSFYRFAILLSPEVPPTVSGRDSFLAESLISFQKSLHSPIRNFESIDWERSWSSFSLKNFISCLKAARALHFSSASGPLRMPSNIPVAHCLPVSRIQLHCSLIPPWYIEFWRFLHPKYVHATLLHI